MSSLMLLACAGLILWMIVASGGPTPPPSVLLPWQI